MSKRYAHIIKRWILILGNITIVSGVGRLGHVQPCVSTKVTCKEIAQEGNYRATALSEISARSVQVCPLPRTKVMRSTVMRCEPGKFFQRVLLIASTSAA